MMRLGLAPVTLLTLLLTGTWMTYAGWFASRGGERTTPRRPDLRAHAQARDGWHTSEAAWRYRRAQPRHWGALVLHR
jgi:hypothetical protein